MCRNITSAHTGKESKIIMMTGYHEESMKGKAMKMDAYENCEKTIPSKKLSTFLDKMNTECFNFAKKVII